MDDNDMIEADKKKIRISSEFLLQSPPGEFNEVFNDVRALLNNDALLERGCARAIADYNKDQFVPVKIAGADAPTLITKYNELKDGRFVDPKSAKIFKYNHLRKEASDIVPAGEAINETLEFWRKTLQAEVNEYIAEHFDNTGVATVFNSDAAALILCIESHQFQPKNFWTGRWRSEWRIPAFDDHKGKTTECTGRIRLQVHYYEEGNVQLISIKNTRIEVKYTFDIKATSKSIIKAICENESAYQSSIQESYATMSDTTFKALRRPLPITRSKLDWLKVQAYRVAHDIKPQ